MSLLSDDILDEVHLDPDDLAARLKQPEVARAIARLLLARARRRLTTEPTPVPAQEP